MMKKGFRPVMRAAGSVAVLACALAGTTGIRAEDWPEHRGKGDLGVWNETGIVDTFPARGLPVRWRTSINGGDTSPVVANGRVFVADFVYTTRPRGTERALALDERTGKILWTREWDADYTGIGFTRGPHATPTVDDDRVYFLGAAGDLLCLNSKTGEVLWKKNYLTDFHARTEQWPAWWGFSSPPLIDGDRVICLVGGYPDAGVVAFDKRTGKELWRAVSGEFAPAFSPLIIIQAGGTRQLISWNIKQVSSLDPETGRIYWQIPWSLTQLSSVVTPVQAGSLLFFSSFYNGSLMLELDDKKPGARVFWKSKSDNEVITDALHNAYSTSVVIGDYIYGIDSYGQLRCLKLKTGERVWETMAVVVDRTQFANAHIVRNGDRVFIHNDRGELIIAKLAPDGYHEISRTPLIKPTVPFARRVRITAHPAFANKHFITRNDEEIISISLAANGETP
jgi:outer membrane protein assembly factor BamB